MSDSNDRPKDAGDALRDGVRSITGILGALKDAIEDTLKDFTGESAGGGGGGSEGAEAPDGVAESNDGNGGATHEAKEESAFERAQKTVEEVRDRFDFVTRRDFEALRRQVEELRARLDELASAGPAGGAAVEGGGGEAAGTTSPGNAGFRFEVE